MPDLTLEEAKTFAQRAIHEGLVTLRGCGAIIAASQVP